jgi:hypothetical protein
MLSNWRHSGFQVICGQCIFPQDKKAMEGLAGSSGGLQRTDAESRRILEGHLPGKG